MKTVDIEIEAESVRVEHTYASYKVKVIIDNADCADLDKEEIAKCVSIDTFIKTHGEDNVMDYLRENFIWDQD